MKRPPILLLRHGSTDWSDEHRFTSRSDVPLNAIGEREAAAAGEALVRSGIRLARVVSSPAQRARRTAEIVAGVVDPTPPVELDERLAELGFGPFEGLTPGQLEARIGHDAFVRARESGQLPGEGPERIEDAAARTAAAFADAAAQGSGPVLLVGHAYAFRLLITRAVLALPLAHLRRIRVDPARLALIAWEGDQPQLAALNAIDVRLDSS